jgi:CubicO group peptidase (beta-lactamase class C family)
MNQVSSAVDDTRLARVRWMMDKGVEDGVFPGAVAGLARNGEMIFEHAAGRQQTAPEPRGPMPVDAMFDLASLTKPISGIALMLCIEDGLLALDDQVGRFVPEFAQGDKSAVRIRHIVSHTSGVQSNPRLHNEHKGWDTLLPAYLALPLAGAPGSLFLYSSINFILLALIIERASGRTLDALLKERVFGPMGLSITYNPPESLKPRIPPTDYVEARGSSDWGVVNDKTAQKMGGVSAHAGLFGSAADLIDLGSMLLQGGTHKGVRIMSPAAARLFTSPWTDERGAQRGLCWLPASPRVYGDLLAPKALAHTGHTGTAMCLVPAEKLVAVLLTNRVHPSRDNDRIEAFRPLFFNTVAAALTGN